MLQDILFAYSDISTNIILLLLLLLLLRCWFVVTQIFYVSLSVFIIKVGILFKWLLSQCCLMY